MLKVLGLGYRVKELGYRVEGSGFKGLGSKVWGSDLGFRVHGIR